MPVANSVEFLECPVCTEQFRGRVLMCSKGHSVCEACRKHLTVCPICKDKFLGTRNYIVEQLVQNSKTMDELQRQSKAKVAKSTKEPKKAIEKVQQPEVLPHVGPKNYKRNLFAGPVQGKGHFKCLIPKCKLALPICRYLNHLRQLHPDNLVEEKLLTEEFFGTFEMLAEEPLAVKAYQLSKFGVFFLFIAQNDLPDGSYEVNAWVQCVAPDIIANKLRYILKLFLNNQTATFTSIVYGSRKLSDNFREKEHCLQMKLPTKVDKFRGQLRIKPNKGPAVHNKRTVVTRST